MAQRSRKKISLAVLVLMLFAALETVLGITMLTTVALSALQKSDELAKSAGAQLLCMLALGYLAQLTIESLAADTQDDKDGCGTISLMESSG